MPTNDFLPFATAGGANVTAQATYAAAGYVSTGRASGILPSDVYNKIARQSSIAAYLLGQLIVDSLAVDALDNGTVSTVLANLKLAIAKTITANTVQIFTSGSGTYTPTSANVRRIRVRMQAGGGGGGARTAAVAASAGGNSTFGGWTCTGGGAGATAGAGGAGGTASAAGTGTVLFGLTCGDGGVSSVQVDATSDAQASFVGGIGGASPFGGTGVPTATGGGAAKTNSGSGGAGGLSLVATKGGGGGGAGGFVEFYVNNPAAVSYAVGAAGTGGTAGGSAGGAGGSGIIIIEESYGG